MTTHEPPTASTGGAEQAITFERNGCTCHLMVAFESPCGDYGGSEPDERDATAADIIAALRTNATLAQHVLDCLDGLYGKVTQRAEAAEATLAAVKSNLDHMHNVYVPTVETRLEAANAICRSRAEALEAAERQAEELRGQLEAARAELATERGLVEEYIKLTKVLRAELAAAQAELERVRAELEYERADDEERDPVNGQLVAARVGVAPAEPKPAEPGRICYCWSCGKLQPVGYARCGRCNQTPDEDPDRPAEPQCTCTYQPHLPTSAASWGCPKHGIFGRSTGPNIQTSPFRQVAEASAVEPVCWCRQCDETPPFRRSMILCPTCGNKRCPKASWHGYQCTGSNEPGQLGVEEDKQPAEPALPTASGDEGACYCSDRMSAGLPCLPGKCPNTPARIAAYGSPAEPALPTTRLDGGEGAEAVASVRVDTETHCGDSALSLLGRANRWLSGGHGDGPERVGVALRYVIDAVQAVAQEQRDALDRGELIAAMRRVGAFGYHITGPAALERLADELERGAKE